MMNLESVITYEGADDHFAYYRYGCYRFQWLGNSNAFSHAKNNHREMAGLTVFLNRGQWHQNFLLGMMGAGKSFVVQNAGIKD